MFNSLVFTWENFELTFSIFPRRYFHIRRSGGLAPHIKFGGKIWAIVQPISPLRGKTWEVLLPQDAKVGKKSQFCGHIRNSEGKIWGICLLYFWRQNLGLQHEFQRQILGPSPPRDLLIWKYPPEVFS